MPQCQIHNTEMQWREGTSKKTGRPYGFFGCSIRNPDGSFCRYQPPKPENPTQHFEQGLDKSASQEEQLRKDNLITRTAVAKSLIERGSQWNVETAKEAEAWVRWIKGQNALSGSLNGAET